MDKNKVAYDLAMCYTQELLRRMRPDQVLDFVQTAPKVKETFDMVYEVLTGSLPDEK